MKEKVVIVSGGTGALGRCVVEKFVDENIKVYVPSTSLKKFNEIFDGSINNEKEFKLRKIYSFVCDATDEKSVSDFVKNVAALENGKIDILINTVGGIHSPMYISDMSGEFFSKYWNLNFQSTFLFTREVLKYMKANESGRIVSIGAIAGLETTVGRFAYAISKSAVINLMNTVSFEMKNYNIRCNSIVPGIMDTAANREWGSEEDIKKWVKPEEVASIIFDLISDNYKSVRESIIKVYGNY
jgi:NAD(P)-dependent dehydrogenase (short-subunit alcohol dehydrogenase family)